MTLLILKISDNFFEKRLCIMTLNKSCYLYGYETFNNYKQVGRTSATNVYVYH